MSTSVESEEIHKSFPSTTPDVVSGTTTIISGEVSEEWPPAVVSPKAAKPMTTGYVGHFPDRIRRDPMTIERCNLLTVIKLVIKELIDSSLKHGRMIEDDHVPLQQFFVVLEHVLRHGIKPKKGLLRDTREFWQVLELVEKYEPDAADITTSVRAIPNIKTPLGRSRAWLRLALMQKRLADYFKIIVEKKDDVLCDYYEAGATMLDEESFVISGLLLGLNVIDCNFSIKDQNLDEPMGVIDFSLYMKDFGPKSPEEENNGSEKMAAILDQKNYLEELNRHLNATVTNLQQKLESIQTGNTLMREDLAIAKTNIVELQRENSVVTAEKEDLLSHHSKQLEATKEDIETERETYQTSREGLDSLCQDLHNKLREETQTRLEVERELELQISLKQEMEMAVRLLEKDIHEKQDSVISLRKQLDDIKAINIEMYNKLQEKDTSLEHKTDMVGRLEEKTNQMAQTIHDIESRQKQFMSDKQAAEETARKLGQQLADKDSKRSALETDLKIEKEWRATLQRNLEQEKEKNTKLQQDMQHYRDLKKEHESLKKSFEQMRRTCEEQEATLRDLGSHLSESKLKMEDMKEVQQAFKEAQWTDDRDVLNCRQCEKAFSVSRRKHHCRSCGDIFCNECSDNKMPLPSSAKPVRVCDSCQALLLQRYSAT